MMNVLSPSGKWPKD